MNTRAPEVPDRRSHKAAGAASSPEAVFACELEAGHLIVSYVNPAFCTLLGLGPSAEAAGRPFFDLVEPRLGDAARAELRGAIESGRQVRVRLEAAGDADRELRLTVKPASVANAWVGSVRPAEPEPEAGLVPEPEQSLATPPDAASPEVPVPDAASPEAALPDTGPDRTRADLIAELPEEALHELIPELAADVVAARVGQPPAAEPPAPEPPPAEPLERDEASEPEQRAAAPATASQPASASTAPARRGRLASVTPLRPPSAHAPPQGQREGPAAPPPVPPPAELERILEPRAGKREASLARALDAAGITWVEQDLATGALTVAGRRLHDPEAETVGRGPGLDRLIYPGDQERRRAALEALTEGRSGELYCAYRVRDAAGTWQWMLETGHLVHDADADVRYVGTVQQVPDRESVEVEPDPHAFPAEHAHALAERFHLPGALVEIHYSAEGRIELTFLAGRIAGIDLLAAQQRPESLLARLDPRDRAELESRCALAAAERSAWECRFGYACAEGERRSASLRVEPVPFDGAGALFRGFILEDTERSRVEQALGESERRFRQLYESAPFMMHSIDASGAIVSVNMRWITKLGYERSEVIGGFAERIFAPESKRLADVGVLAREEGDGFRERECQLLTRDGRQLEGLVSARIERDDAGRLAGAHFLLIDVTDRNRAMQALKDSEARFRAVVEDQTEAICRFDSEGRIVFANDACVRATSAIGRPLHGSSWFDLLDELQARSVRSELSKLTPEQPVLQRELRMTELDARLFQWTIRAFFDGARRLTEFQGVGRDMEGLRRLEAQIREVSQREQRRIGHDLHDGLGQELTGVSLMLRKLELDAAAEAPTLGGRVASVRRMVNQCLATARSLARGLSPLELERGGLAGALRQLAANAEEMYEVAISVECAADAVVNDEDTASELYRIAQEATNNAAKHAAPTCVAIRLLRDGPRLVLEIEDDGSGLPVSAQTGGGLGLGLKIMRYRANIIGASIEFVSDPDQGTLVRCQLQRPT